MVSRRRSLDDSQNTVAVTDEQVKKSIAGAGLHFPGEERVNQDRFNSDIGAVSSRTRHRCNKAKVNESYGTVERNVGKYDSEGLLTSDFNIHDLRTVDSMIECEISEMYGTDGSRSWEPLHAVATNQGIYQLESVYRKKLKLAAGNGRVMQSLPSPRDITVITDAFRENNDHPFIWPTYRRQWKELQERYKAQMNKLTLENDEKPDAEEEEKPSTKTSKATARGRGRGKNYSSVENRKRWEISKRYFCFHPVLDGIIDEPAQNVYMTPVTMSVIAALDAPHPKQNVTQRNSGASPLLKLPLEARLMIYEFAVEVDKPISPIQLGDGSNKFHWDGRWHLSSPPSCLTVTELARTCRMVYHDLEAKPVFYRTNSFQFTEIRYLHSFLAAITPARRASIRQIEVSHYQDFKGWDVYGKVMPLLLQCHDLRQLSFVAAPYGTGAQYQYLHPSSDPIPALRDSLNDCLKLMTGTPYDDPSSVMNVPGFQLCIEAAGIHFPGEDRIHLNRLDSDIGSISSRTRHRCNTANINTSTGKIERAVGKYGPEGLLVDYFNIEGVKRVGSDIKCQISTVWWTGDKSKSWEPLHTVTTTRGISLLLRFYRENMHSVSVFEKVAQSLPPPRDIAHFAIPQDAENGRQKKGPVDYQRDWAKLQERYETRMEQLTSRNNQKASRAQKAARKTAEKTKKKTEKTPKSAKRG
ncbi:hypothetical protein PG984_002338 [Apiospora sp. TS-2023a]